ncbi:uncharacterized protein LOC111254253 isoform X2 [Varroa destructor]|uniref:Uncharacterized protein n=1 Tax=Varroa destructor TaxID=109461 RepID=A0A7M7KTW1_VARDE|nr:uncharacterized protein LOC111254253 isoform X2 [Varroa destructor]
MEEIEVLRNSSKETVCIERGPECVVDALDSHRVSVIAIFIVFGITAIIIIPYALFASDENDVVIRRKETSHSSGSLDLDLEGGPHNTSVSGFTHASPISGLTHHFHMKNLVHLDSFKQYARRLSQFALGGSRPSSRRGSVFRGPSPARPPTLVTIYDEGTNEVHLSKRYPCNRSNCRFRLHAENHLEGVPSTSYA